MQLIIREQVDTNVYALITNVAGTSLEKTSDTSIAEPAK